MNSNTISMNYLKLTDNYYLVEQTVRLNREQKKAQPVNHVWIFDRSGSMWGQIKALVEHLINLLSVVKPGDTITTGWFSSQGNFNWIIKGYQVSDQASLDKLKQLFLQNNYTLGMTCFSEILASLSTVLADLKVFSDKNVLMFFTDGHPVVSNHEKELKDIKEALSKVSKQFVSAMFIGYGDYYNKELMTEMAATVGGQLVHRDDIGKVYDVMSQYTLDSESLSGKQGFEVEYLSRDGIYFTLSNNEVVMLDADQDDNVWLPIPEDESQVATFYYTLEDNRGFEELVNLELESNEHYHSPVTGIDLSVDVLNTHDTDVLSMLNAAYALGFVFLCRQDLEKAVLALKYTGDINIVEKVNNAFTPQEFGELEQLLKQAIFYIKSSGKDSNVFGRVRFEGGRKYLYDGQEAFKRFSVLDLFKLLMEDEQARFYPKNPTFNYKAIGAPSRNKEGWPKFEADKTQGVKFDRLVWNSKRLNLSVGFQLRGTVELKEPNYKDFGFQSPYPTFQHKTYTMVADGKNNVKTLPCSFSEETYNILKYKASPDLIDEDKGFYEDKIYTLNLAALPVINKATVDASKNLDRVRDIVNEEHELKFYQKILNYILKDDEEVEQNDLLTEEQVKFLEACGISKQGYQPEEEKVLLGDQYPVIQFEIRKVGGVSIPSINDVNKKINSNKKLNANDTLVKNLYDNYSAFSVEELKHSQAKVRGRLFRLRSELAEMRIGIVLGRANFNGLVLDRKGAVIDTFVDAVGNENKIEFAFKPVDIHI